jgi:AcrR family transcriptional regulator
MRQTAPGTPAPQEPADQRVREAAIRLFAARGFAATGIREIATEAGVASSVLYHYYANKDDLLLSIMRQGLTRSIATARQVLEGLERPEVRLSVLAQLHVATQSLGALGATVVDNETRSLGGEARDEILLLRDEYESLWRDCLQDGREQDVFSFEDARLTRLALIEMCNGPARWYHGDGPEPLERITRIFSDLVLSTVHARRGRRTVTTADLNGPTAETIVEAVKDSVADEPGASS